jgi:hypothetical protein
VGTRLGAAAGWGPCMLHSTPQQRDRGQEAGPKDKNDAVARCMSSSAALECAISQHKAGRTGLGNHTECLPSAVP